MLDKLPPSLRRIFSNEGPKVPEISKMSGWPIYVKLETRLSPEQQQHPAYAIYRKILESFGNPKASARLAGGLRELIGNAFDSAPRESPIVEIGANIFTTPKAEGQLLILVVRDNGQGFSDKMLAPDALEESRVSFKIRGEMHGGTGRGLHLLSEYVHALGGKIQLGNRNDGESGAFVIVILPIEGKQT